MEEPLMEVKAHTGTIYLYEDKIKIEHSKKMLFSSDTEIDMNDIYEVPITRAGAITTGILKFRTGKPGSLTDNRVRFSRDQEKEILQLRNEVKRRTSGIESSEKSDPLDQIEKLKELLDSGAISQEEFEEKKAELLDKL